MSLFFESGKRKELFYGIRCRNATVLIDSGLQRRFIHFEYCALHYACGKSRQRGNWWSGVTPLLSKPAAIKSFFISAPADHINLLMEGRRRIDELEYFADQLPQKSAVLRVIRDQAMLENLVLMVVEWETLRLMDGKRTLQDVCNEGRPGGFGKDRAGRFPRSLIHWHATLRRS